MTVAYLMNNTVTAAVKAWKHAALANWTLRYLPLKPLEKVGKIDFSCSRASRQFVALTVHFNLGTFRH